MMMRLGDKLLTYAGEDYYPFHMPGHKRNLSYVNYKPSIETDITEIDGFDNLHHAEEILLEVRRRASGLFGVKETYYSVNGSTACLLSAISACTTIGGKILMARNCHKAVYHAVYLRQLTPVYLYPEIEKEYGISCGIRPQDVDKILKAVDKIEAVVITSPTYDGVTSDVAAICEIAHTYGIPVIVDEAHGAHFIFHDKFPVSAITAGADFIIHSVHKTLPSMTQTSLIHYNSSLVSEEKLVRYLAIYQSSSPSYPLMASIDSCICDLMEHSEEWFVHFISLLEEFYEKMKGLRNIEIAGKVIYGENQEYCRDFSKILLSLMNLPMTGSEFYTILLNKYHLQMEMDSRTYVLGISTIADTREGFRRLTDACLAVDGELEGLSSGDRKKRTAAYPSGEALQSMAVWKAVDKKRRYISLEESGDCISGDFVSLYPPGIPLLVPGEIITGDMADYIRQCRMEGLMVHGLNGNGLIGVIDE